MNMCQEREERRPRTEAWGMTKFKRQSKRDPTRVCERRSKKNRKEKHPGIYRASNVTEAKQGEQWKDDTGFSHLSAGTWPEHLMKGVGEPECSRWKNGWKGTMSADYAFGELDCEGRGLFVGLICFVLKDWRIQHIFMREKCQ